MANNRTIVEINGKKYDARTGQIVTDTANSPGSKVIDGFQAPITAPASPTNTAVTRTVNSSASMHQKPQKTKKLHPAAANRMVTPKRVIAQSAAVARAAEQPNLQAKQVAGQNQARAERAQTTAQSEHVQKFQTEIPETPQQVPEPADIPPQPRVEPMRRPVQATPEPQVETEKEPGVITRLRSKRPKLVPAAITAVMVLAVGGYVAYQNLPRMALQVAASRAGFNASLPGYSPSGFSFSGPVSYAEGIVELEYSSNSDDTRAFRLIQRESSWDSQSLLDNFVANASDDYLTYQERGLTVYIYDTSNATWVDGGIWYTIEGNSQLSSEQLLKIAGSL